MFVPGNPPSWMETWPNHQGAVWPSIDQGAMMATGKTNTHNHRWLSLLVIFKYINIMCIYTYTYIYIYTHVLKDSIWGYSIYIIYIPRRSQNVDTSDLQGQASPWPPGLKGCERPRRRVQLWPGATQSSAHRLTIFLWASKHPYMTGLDTLW